MTNTKYAHTLPGCSDKNQWQTLEKHLQETALEASKFAGAFDSHVWGRNAALLHDLGKLADGFQEKLHDANGLEYENESPSGRVNHSGAGAAWAEGNLNAFVGRTLAYLVAGHHAGLPDYMNSKTGNASWKVRKTEADDDLAAIQAETEPYVSELQRDIVPPKFVTPENYHMWVRMLFSCLVDADWLDTERFMDREKYETRPKFPDIAELAEKFDQHMAQFDTCEQTPLNKIRREILDHCRNAAEREPGLFTLTVPTGGGKTLSSMAFALKHAVKYGKKRIIYVIPYTSIIDQTVTTLRDIFDKDVEKGHSNVVEHHSNIANEKKDDENEEEKKKREEMQAILDLAAENWDAPIIVTTNVQFFESLYSAKPRRCRKLHNIVDSVVLLDEAQLISPDYLVPCVDVINELTSNYKVSMVLCTATQPALPGIKKREDSEIIPDPQKYYGDLKRTEIHFPEDMNQPVTWEELADKLMTHEKVLCVVNTRLDCRTLYDLVRKNAENAKDTIHLSALMCGQHRSDVIEEIRKRLNEPGPLRVISTQLVEAGVDMDFPIVYRALAGLDSIVQAAGRCNREGKQCGYGQVYVFVPPKQAPTGLLRKGEDSTKELLGLRTVDPDNHEIYQHYFKLFYNKISRNNNIPTLYRKMLIDEVCFNEDDEIGAAVDFRSFGDIFRLIDDKDSVSIIVKYGDGKKLIDDLKKEGPTIKILRQLQRYTINLKKCHVNELKSCGHLVKLDEFLCKDCNLVVQNTDSCYCNDFGFDILAKGLSPEDLVF